MTPPRVIECDVAVVGGGPAGIAAAATASERGARTVIIDSGLRLGGQIWRHVDVSTLPATARAWLNRLDRSGATKLLRATVLDGDPVRGLIVADADTATRVVARRIVLATGARERLLPYPGWTLPNVMGVGGAQAMLKSGVDVRGKRVIVAGSGPLLLPVAAALNKSGARLTVVAEQVDASTLGAFALSLWSQPSKLRLAAQYRSQIPLTAYRTGTWVERADGDRHVETVTLTTGSRRWTERCDLLCCAYGLVPATELPRLMGCDVIDGRVVVDPLQRTTVDGVVSAGETTGIAGDDAAITEGEIAGIVAASVEKTPSLPAGLRARQRKGQRFALHLAETFRPRDELRRLANADTVVCRCEDVRLGQLDSTWSGRQAKLYTRVGMGPCQGMTCAPALEYLCGWGPGSVRPPLFAPALGTWIAEAPSALPTVMNPGDHIT